MEIQRLARRARQIFAKQGLTRTVLMSLEKAKDLAAYPVMKRRNAAKSFRVGQKSHPYFIHHYNSTWRNERAVEVPLVADLLASVKPGARCLEVGNVLNYYLDFQRTVVDKYESGAGVINEDILEFGAAGSYDVIVSISTLEHVGWDEEPRDLDKVRRAFEHIKGLLAPGGRCLITFPMGYNSALDELVFAGKLGFKEIHFLQRTTADNEWREVEMAAVRGVTYGAPYPFANALFVGID